LRTATPVKVSAGRHAENAPLKRDPRCPLSDPPANGTDPTRTAPRRRTATIATWCAAIVAGLICGTAGDRVALAQSAAISPSPVAIGQSVDARALYDAAYNRWHALPSASFATYETTVHIVEHGRTTIRREDIAYRRKEPRCLVVGKPLDARDRPDPPHVTDRCLAPDAAFTLLRQNGETGASALPIDLATPAPTASPSDEPHTIGRVVAHARSYEPTYAGDEQIGTLQTAHLTLRPVGDPNTYILRDMWIDRATLGVVRLRGQVSLAARFAVVNFTVDYDETATTQVVRKVVGYAKAQVLFVKAGADFDFDLTNDAYPRTLPDWYFEKNGYAEHHSPALDLAPDATP